MSLYSKWKTILAERKVKQAAKAKQAEKVKKQLAWKDELVDRAEKKVEQYKPGPKTAISYARKYIGTVEHPAGSNQGPHINDWLADVGIKGWGAPWCGAFAHAVLKHAGVKGLSDRMRYTPYIVADGKAGINGLEKEVAWADRKPGDLLLFDFDGGGVDHVGLFVSDRADGLVNTIEGNTTSGPGGPQANGGGVFARARSRNLVAHVIRPRYRA